MARKLVAVTIDTRNARLKKLKPRAKPYWHRIGPKAHLGYRRLAKRDGSWTLRTYTADPSNPYAFKVLGHADDYSDADGVDVLTFDQAVNTARERMSAVTKAAATFTVADAVALYLKDIEADGRDPAALAEIQRRLEKIVVPALVPAADKPEELVVLGTLPVAELTADQLKAWRQSFVTSAPLDKTGKPRKAAADTEEAVENAKRARRATATRNWHGLKAVLNHAFNAKKVASDAEWKRIKALKDIDKSRGGFLSENECQRLINAADPEFRPLVRAGLFTGARYGSLCKLRVRDFDADAGTVKLQTRKGKDSKLRVYHTHLNTEGVRFFRAACAGRKGSDFIFTRNDGQPWTKSQQQLPMAAACKNAGISPPIGFHGLKHAYISLAVKAGMSYADIGANVATSAATIEKHYAHLHPDNRNRQVEQYLPKFGFDAGNLAVLP